MDQKQLRKQMKSHGYAVRFTNQTRLFFSNDESKCTIKQEFFHDKSVWLFELVGPKPSDDLLNDVVAYLEQLMKEQQAVLFFKTSDFHYVHPSYYTFGNIHSVTSPYEEELHSLFHALYQACVKEEQKDPLFEWTFEPSQQKITLRFVKTNALNKMSISHNAAGFFITIETKDTVENKHIVTLDGCVSLWEAFLQQVDHQNRLPSLYETSSYYTTRFLNNIRINGKAADRVFHHLCETHDAEVVEQYFKRLTDNQVTLLKNKNESGCFLVQLMDTWVVKSWKLEKPVAFFPYNRFDDALALYKELLFDASLFTYTAEAIDQIQTRMRKDEEK